MTKKMVDDFCFKKYTKFAIINNKMLTPVKRSEVTWRSIHKSPSTTTVMICVKSPKQQTTTTTTATMTTTNSDIRHRTSFKFRYQMSTEKVTNSGMSRMEVGRWNAKRVYNSYTWIFFSPDLHTFPMRSSYSSRGSDDFTMYVSHR